MRNLRRREQQLDSLFGAFCDERRDQVARATLRNYEVEWASFCRWARGQVEPLVVSNELLQGYVDHLSVTRNSVGVNTGWRQLRPFLNWLHAEGHLGFVPAVRVPAQSKKQKMPLSDDEVRALLRACLNPRDKAMLLLILDTGLRSREVRELRRSEVDLSGRLVWVASGKGGKSRQVPFSSATARALRGWDEVREPETPWFFHNADHEYGTQMSVWHVNRTFARLGERAGIEGPVGPHRLRHTFGRSFIAQGGDVYSLQRMLGHTTLSTSMIYVNLSGKDLANVHRQVSPVVNVLYEKKKE